MPKESDIKILDGLPPIKILGEGFGELQKIKHFKGKFVIISGGKFLAKLFPIKEYEKVSYYHNMMLEELGVKDAMSDTIQKEVMGGGKMEVELVDDYVECKLYGKSTNYGEYDKNDIDPASLEMAIREAFKLGDMPVLVIPDFEKVTA